MCVRLLQGDFDQETVFSSDPAEVAKRWQKGGAARLHIVDLDGARTGKPSNVDAISHIAAAVDLPLQVGGGIRSRKEAERLLRIGADRIVLGTAAVHDPEMVRDLCHHIGDQRVVVAVDARDGLVAIEGWREATSVEALELMQRMAELGVSRFLYTDILRDGTLTEPNFQAIAELMAQTQVPILASGGVSSSEHVSRLAKLGVEGVVLGRALYTGDLTLAEALQAAAHPGP